MSAVYKGNIIDTALSNKAMGGTELMRSRLLSNIDNSILNKYAIHFSRPTKIYTDVKNIFYAHDLPEDKCNDFLYRNMQKFAAIVYVSNHQKTRFQCHEPALSMLPTYVIPNALDVSPNFCERDTSTIRFIYHTTPHRGLELVYPIFKKLCENFNNIHLDVYSSFGVYNWPERDAEYKSLFAKLDNHPNITNHGAVSNDVILHKLKQSHVFLYPSIWEETSCLALMEAINNGVIAIHNNYGALYETASNNTIMYDYSHNKNINASRCYVNAKKLLTDFDLIYPNHLNVMKTKYSACQQYTINNFIGKWNYVLSEVDNI